jgi:hypothetical protein
MTAEDQTAICYRNAQALFPRFAAGHEKATT